MTIHYGQILKRSVIHLWDTLSDRDQSIIASYIDKERDLSKWFAATVAMDAKTKYESLTYWSNEAYSFRYGNQVLPVGWEG